MAGTVQFLRLAPCLATRCLNYAERQTSTPNPKISEIMEDNPMNEDVFAGQWKQMRGELKTWWGRLAEDDFDRIGGQKDKLIGLVQERYGYTRGDAEEEVERRFKEYSAKMSGGMARMAAKAQAVSYTHLTL